MASELWEPIKQRWAALSSRERQGVRLATLLVGLALVWFVLIAPAWRTLSRGPAERNLLDAQVQSMQSLQMQARQLQSQPSVAGQDALRAIQASAGTLGASARVQVLGDQVTVTMQQVPADALAQWLSRTNGTTLFAPQQVHVQRAPDTTGWSGTVVFRLPPGTP